MIGEGKPVFVIKVQRDLAVGLGDETVAFGAQILADRSVAIEFAVDDEVKIAARMSHRLVAVIQADDT